MAQKFHVKRGDQVVVIAGSHKGKTGKVLEIIAKSRDEHLYDLPPELIGKLWGGKYRGQRQIWFLARFLGKDSHIDIQTKHPEFREWKWAAPETLPELIVPFKRKLYRDILQEFHAMLS